MDIPALLYNDSHNDKLHHNHIQYIEETTQDLKWFSEPNTNTHYPELPTELRPSRSCETTTSELPSLYDTFDEKTLKRRSGTLPPSPSTASFSSHVSADQERRDRRERNKMASAKYRAKRNQETANMRRTVEMLRKQNNYLQQQLNEAHHDRSRMCARLDQLQDYIINREKNAIGPTMTTAPTIVSDQDRHHHPQLPQLPSKGAYPSNTFNHA